MCLSIYPSTYPSIHPSICVPIDHSLERKCSHCPQSGIMPHALQASHGGVTGATCSAEGPDLFEPENGVGPLCPPADSGSRTVHFKRLSQVHNGPLRQHTLVHKPVPRRSRDRQQRWRRWQHHVFKRKRADRNVHHATCSTRHVCNRNRATCRRQGTLADSTASCADAVRCISRGVLDPHVSTQNVVWPIEGDLKVVPITVFCAHTHARVSTLSRKEYQYPELALSPALTRASLSSSAPPSKTASPIASHSPATAAPTGPSPHKHYSAIANMIGSQQRAMALCAHPGLGIARRARAVVVVRGASNRIGSGSFGQYGTAV